MQVPKRILAKRPSQPLAVSYRARCEYSSLDQVKRTAVLPLLSSNRSRKSYSAAWLEGAFTASVSDSSIFGASTNSSSAFAIRALAISPVRCAPRAASVPNVSNMPNERDPVLKANQLVVPCSASAKGKADLRKSSTSFSFPGFASSFTKIEKLNISLVYECARSEVCRYLN